eukprot:TRINITY_DN67496_c11_g1_i1.p1 TRINITY_DN67496_c11_g1~~TRINITY_DN67496_c11_g1_i1.p1  ORF type:complete len:456 (+),score=47.76 TRINITY_DN67496_c11_g1_i1:88-1455(+)
MESQALEALVKSTLKQCIESKQQIICDKAKKKIVMRGTAWDRDIPIHLSVRDAQPIDKDYSLFDIWFYCYVGGGKNYFNAARENGARFISYVHRRWVAEELFVDGKTVPSELFLFGTADDEATGKEEAEPPTKKPKIELTDEQQEEWNNFLHRHDNKELGADHITMHWTAKQGPPELADKWATVVQSDDSTTQYLKQRQELVNRKEAMQVLPNAKDTNTNFFADVLPLIHAVRRNETRQPVPPTPSLAQREEAIRTKLHPAISIPIKMSEGGGEEVNMLPEYKPIIIVPTASSSLITLWNAQELLENGNFVSTQEIKKRMHTKPTHVTVSCSHFLKKQEADKMRLLHKDFRVIDNPEKLKPYEWDFVACVFVTGVTWQFAGWFAEDPVTIFSAYRGYHLTFAEDQPHPVTSKWKVKRLMIPKDDQKRYKDKLTIRQFWVDLAQTTLRLKSQFYRT